MKVTPKLRAEINRAVRENVKGASPSAEVGLRSPRVDDDLPYQPNALLWTDDSDLGDQIALRLLREINDDPEHPGCAELDLYVTTGRDIYRELETNVYVFIRDGAVIGATSHEGRIEPLRQRLGFPATRGW